MSEQRIAIVTDSTADLVPELVRARGITVVPLTVVLDGRGYLDGVEITAAEFYARLAAAAAGSGARARCWAPSSRSSPCSPSRAARWRPWSGCAPRSGPWPA